jgi:hypothetical protein
MSDARGAERPVHKEQPKGSFAATGPLSQPRSLLAKMKPTTACFIETFEIGGGLPSTSAGERRGLLAGEPRRRRAYALAVNRTISLPPA